MSAPQPPTTGVGYGRWLIVSTALLLCSCASYRAAPIDPAAVHQAWLAIDLDTAAHAVNNALDADQIPADGFDLADGISLAEAEIAALFFNPSIRATRLEVGIPEAEARYAHLWEDPELGVDAEYILDSVDEPLISSVGLSITIPLSGRRSVARAVAEAEVEHLTLAVIGAEWALITTLRSHWLELANTEAEINLLSDSLATIQSLIDLAPSFRAAQAMTTVDERWLEIQRLHVVDALQQATAMHDQQRLVIIQLLGLHPDHPWNLTASFGELEPFQRQPDLTQLLGHPRLRQMMAAYQVAEHRLHLEVRKQYPDLTIGFGLGYEDGGSRIGLGLGLLPVPLWNRNRAGIATATTEREVAGASITTAIQDLVHAERAAQSRLTALTQRLSFFHNQLIPLVDQQVADARRLTGLGQLDLPLLSEAVALARSTRLELLHLTAAQRSAALNLDAMVGPADLSLLTRNPTDTAAPTTQGTTALPEATR